jgi:hypothetical protein
MPKKRKQNPQRYRAARTDATVSSIERHIEKAYDLPQASVRIVLPDGSVARSNKKIRNLLKDYSS